jgi:hypothetical protein
MINVDHAHRVNGFLIDAFSRRWRFTLIVQTSSMIDFIQWSSEPFNFSPDSFRTS